MYSYQNIPPFKIISFFSILDKILLMIYIFIFLLKMFNFRDSAVLQLSLSKTSALQIDISYFRYMFYIFPGIFFKLFLNSYILNSSYILLTASQKPWCIYRNL